MVLFIMLYKLVLTSTSVDKIPVFDLSDEGYRAVLSCRTIKRQKYF